jgi:PEP-CTERM motif-containing protein
MRHSMTIRGAFSCAAMAAVLLPPAFAWAIPCESGGISISNPCTINDLQFSNPVSTGFSGGGGNPPTITIDTTLLNPGLQFANPAHPFTILNGATAIGSLGITAATIDGLPRIHDLNLSLLSVFLTPDITLAVDIPVPGGGNLHLDQNNTSGSISFPAVSTFNVVMSIAAAGRSEDSFGSVAGFKINFSELAAPTAVPEPSTWLLLGSGLAGLIVWRRKSCTVPI